MGGCPIGLVTVATRMTGVAARVPGAAIRGRGRIWSSGQPVSTRGGGLKTLPAPTRLTHRALLGT